MNFSRCLRRLQSAAAGQRARLAALLCLTALPACSLLPHHHQEGNSASAASPSESGTVGRKSSSRGLIVELRAAPDPVKLGEVRQLDVTLTLRNTSKEPVNLKFATSQVLEILLRDQASGKVVSQWSTDQTFQPGTRYVVVNPHERLEYNQPITTRELHAGVTYSLEAYFFGYDQELRATRPLIPLP